MPDYNKVLAGHVSAATNIAVATGVNATVTATQAPASTSQILLITKIIITGSDAPAAAVRATVKRGSTTMFTLSIPPGQFGLEVDFGTHPIALESGESLVVAVPALGSGITCDVALFTVSCAA